VPKTGTVAAPEELDFRGEIGRRRVVPGFVLTELRHRRGSKSRSHAHRLAYFSALVSGTYAERESGRETVYRIGDVRFHPAEYFHGDEIGSAGARFLCVELASEGSAALPGAALAAPRMSGPSSDVARLAASIRREMRSGDAASDLVLEGLALQLVGALVRLPVESRLPRWLARVAERIREESARPLRAADLAAEAGVHPVHLARAFRRHYHRTIGEAVRRARVDAVLRMLGSGAVSLAAAAADAGFSDQSHMSRAFRRETGMSPAEYRRALSERPRDVRIRPER